MITVGLSAKLMDDPFVCLYLFRNTAGVRSILQRWEYGILYTVRQRDQGWKRFLPLLRVDRCVSCQNGAGAQRTAG